MGWFEDQLLSRRKRDNAALSDAYLRLAHSVMSHDRRAEFDVSEAEGLDAALAAIVIYLGMKPIEVPDTVEDANDRINHATHPYGIMRRPVKLEGAWWKDASGAYLGHIKGGSAVAILPNRNRIGYTYVDPISQRPVRINKRTAENLEADALCFYRPLPQRELTIPDVFLFMLGCLDGADITLMFLASAVSLLLGFQVPRITGVIFSSIIPSGMPRIVGALGTLLVGLTVCKALIDVTSSFLTYRISNKLSVAMESAVYARVLLLPTHFFKDYAAGDLTQRAMMMTVLVQVFSEVLGLGISTIFSIGYVFQLYGFTPTLALPATLTLLAEMGATILATRAMMVVNKQILEKQTKVSGLEPAILEGVQKLKLAGAEKRAFAKWGNAYANLMTATFDLPRLLVSAPNLIPLFSLAGTIWIYYIAATTGVDQASYMAFNASFGAVAASILSVTASIQVISQIIPYLEFVSPIMQAVPETLSTQRQITSLRGDIEVAGVSFSYVENGPIILDNFSLRIRRGEYVAICGKTGCGKSTLMRILLGFEKPARGVIYYDGQDISGIDIRSLRQNIGVVMQNGSLLQGDIFSNITITCPGATMDDAWRAAEIAGIAEDIHAMPMGMHTLISEGTGGISGGQRQRIMIARAVCGRPKVLMLDEATSALDNITQRYVSDTLAELDCTRIVIAHRLSTIKMADRIVMIDGGKIIEQGTYDQLMAKNGAFADLVRRQQLESE